MSQTAVSAAQANQSPQQTSKARRLLVILDLNGTLLLRKPTNKARFHKRRGLKDFLRYLLKNHHVAVWSSARPENVRNMFKECSVLVLDVPKGVILDVSVLSSRRVSDCRDTDSYGPVISLRTSPHAKSLN